MRRLIWLIAAALVAACSPGVPSKYVQPDDMEDILFDYHIAMGMGDQSGSNHAYNKIRLKNEVFKKHGLTEAEFDSSMVYYLQHAELLADIYKDLQERLGQEALKYGASEGEVNQYEVISNSGDTANIWRDLPSAVLLPVAPYNKIQFSIKADSSFKKADSFVLGLTSNFLYQEGAKDGVALIALHYTDTTLVFNTHFSSDGITQLRTQPHNADLKDIQGFIYLGAGGDVSQTVKLLYLNDIQLIRIRRKEQVQENKETEKTETKNDTTPPRIEKAPKAGIKPSEL